MTTNLYTALSSNANDVSQEHYLYTKHKEQIQLVNDIYDGVDTSIQYLNQFPQELLTTFQDRQNKATLRNFVKRSVEAFVGMIFRKPMNIDKYGIKVTSIMPKIDTVQSISMFTRDIANALIKDSKTYILVDSPSTEVDGAKPYLIGITRAQLINWRKDANGNFTMVVIKEVIAEAEGLFGTNYIEQYRVYDSDANITLYRKQENTTKAMKKDSPSGYSQYGEVIETDFTSIPLIELSVQDVPILYDISKMNVKHFNRQSHKDRYLTMAALPIPLIWGATIDDEGKPSTAKPALVIGVDEAFIFDGTKQECDFEWRELSGNSIKMLEDDLNSITEDITTGVIRAADSANTVQKTATEIQLLQAEASNRVTVIASIVEDGMKRALEVLSEACLEQVPDDATFLINKDFNSALMGSDGARVVMEQYLSGLLSTETFLQAMADMELINIGSAADEIMKIQNDEFRPTPRINPNESVVTQDNRTKSLTNPQ
jgi:hypothetical protein